MSVENAIVFATQAHAGQLDKQGQPYIYHPLRVMEAVRHRGDAYARVGVLHDVIEDCVHTPGQYESELREILSEEERTALLLVTRAPEGHPERVSYRDFINNIARTEDYAGDIAKAVKLADIHDNLGRLTSELQGMEKRYKMALEILDDSQEHA